MIVQEEEEVEQACAVALQILRRRAVLALSGRVIGEDRLRGRLVDLREAGEVAEADLVAELQAVLDLAGTSTATRLLLPNASSISACAISRSVLWSAGTASCA